ncbi:MAG: UMP kinase, partial [Nanoarchaeota archaeon]
TEMIILSLGGSLIYPREIDVAYLKKFRELILSSVTSGKKFGIVCGGGYPAREYIKKANEVLSLHSELNYMIGIAVTLVNAQLVHELFGDFAYPEVLRRYDKEIKTQKSLIIGGGWKPGCSTDH